MNKKLILVAMTLGIVFTTNVTTLASPSLDSELNTSQSKYNQSQSTLNAAQKKVNDLESNIEMLDGQIQQNMTEVNNIKAKIGKIQTDIDVKEESIKKTEANIKDEQDLYDKRMKAMYTSGNNRYLTILLDSNGLGDFISKAEAVKKIAQFDEKLISSLNDRKKEVEEKKDKLAESKKNLTAMQEESQKKLSALNSKKQEQLPLIAKAKQEEASASTLSASTKAEVDSVKKKILDAKAAENAKVTAAVQNKNVSVNRGGASAGNVSISGNAVIQYAANFLGTTYVWGGTSPNPGFDCSGYMQYVYAHFGVSIGRTTYDQINDGSSVARGDLQPGDLVFFGTYSNPHHVGMYIGNGMYIHAPHTGDVIKISPLDRSDYLTGRRVK
ncbi:Cell wall-associated hydrolase, NlpC family [Clostridium acidisoli DSM 12555]|uniref:Cell wall-associated hydrolase, NlpC family n=1 Tax=Clostridium acidisoli DSM 12555 TaxID=1121291 RepID=A0A1W1XSM6_9CLOT|nr:C40 family peptidase [Clostridium acidisoli]SMC26551.1 Cell wall-associated hydrolase, NlpC family [Clostridium acidisoli DSM 12555]